LDFTQEFAKFDVMTELGLDPLDLGNLDVLRPKLRSMLTEDNQPKGVIETMNDKQLFDKLIEARIESKCHQTPGFIMNHPLIMSPLAKS
jgi:lysyl-tRNA synthetase class II